MNGKWFLAMVISALLGAGLFAAGLLVGLSFGPRLESTSAARLVGPGRMPGPAEPRVERGTAAWEPLTLEGARQAAQGLLERAQLDDLEVGRVLVFSNGAYVAVAKAGSGAGAFEVQVDPRTGRASAEFGPTMVWNTEYGLASGRFPGVLPERDSRRLRHLLDRMHRLPRSRALRFFHRSLGAGQAPPEAEGGVTQDEALAIVGRFLQAHAPDFTPGRQAMSFPGYFTLDVVKDGVVHGLISVNADTGQVWTHVWRGEVIESSE